MRVPLSLALYLSHSRLSPIRLLQFETEYISRSATSTDARQDKWLRDGGYITFQNWPNRRLSGDEKEGPRYIEPAGPYTCIDRRSAARRDEGEARRGEARHGAAPRCIVFSALPQRPPFLKIHRRHAFQTAERFSSVDFLIRKRAPLSYDEERKMEEKERKRHCERSNFRARPKSTYLQISPRCYIICIAINSIPRRYNVFN